jgi:hypothetical protein
MRRLGDEDDEAERDEWRAEAREEAKARSRRCVCDTDGTMPGHCPGPDQCPYSGEGEAEPEADPLDDPANWPEGECTCFRDPPCNWCMELTEAHVEYLDSHDRKRP